VVLGFGALYVVLAVLGRLTVVPETGVSLVWPAAGVAVLWLVARAGRPWLWLDVLVLTAATAGVVTSGPGGPVGLAVITAAHVLQAAVCCLVIARRCPRLWAAHGTRAVTRAELGWFLGAAAAAAAVSAPLAGLGVALSTGAWSWEVMGLWFARNSGAIVLVGSLGLVLGSWWHDARAGVRVSVAAGSRAGELVLAFALTPVIYVAWFVFFERASLVFPLIVLTVWAGLRLPSSLVTVHNAVIGGVVVGLTAADIGPFVHLASVGTEVATAQLYVGLVCVLGLALALDHEERGRLLTDLGAARDRAQTQASLLSTIVDTMSEGVRVTDRGGRLLVRNPAATRLLLGMQATQTAPDGGDLAHVRQLDGAPLAPDALSYRADPSTDDRHGGSSDGQALDLQVQTPGAPEPRIVTFTTAPLPETTGGGVVTVLRDVTAERLELRRAATVQASLLPARMPDVPGYDLAALPAGSVGGDFYDWEHTPDGVVVTLADVMGKGPAAAILAASTRSMLQAHGMGTDVAGTLAATEKALAKDLEGAAAFVTAFRAHLQAEAGLLTYSDAGHGLAFMVRADGSSERLPALGPPLGLGGDRTQATVRIGPGDLLLIFSDGVLDAAGGSLRDLRRYEQDVRATPSAQDAAEMVLDLVNAAGPQDDDLTILVLRRSP
jgi:PAS domain-containing protein